MPPRTAVASFRRPLYLLMEPVRRPAVALTRGVARALTVGCAVLAVLAAVAAPAAAHDALTTTEPANGSTVDVAPDTVRLTFSEEVVELGTEIQVIGPAGLPVSNGATVVQGTVVSRALLPDRPAGTYTVQWRATSSDGHPTSGELTFTSTTAVAPVVAPPVVETPAPSTSPTASASPTTTSTAVPTPAAPADDAGGVSGWAIAAGAGAVAAAAGTWWVRRRR